MAYAGDRECTVADLDPDTNQAMVYFPGEENTVEVDYGTLTVDPTPAPVPMQVEAEIIIHESPPQDNDIIVELEATPPPTCPLCGRVDDDHKCEENPMDEPIEAFDLADVG